MWNAIGKRAWNPRGALTWSAVWVAAVVSSIVGRPAAGQELAGFAVLPADTFAEGPTSGQFLGGGANGRQAPFIDRQPVQGFSAMLAVGDGTFWMMSDNGFGSKGKSPDFVLRIHRVRPDFRTADGGSGTVEVLEHRSLSDPSRLIGFDVVADRTTYPSSDGGDSGIAVDERIRRERLLTGGDLDIESFRMDAAGHFWLGDEFGPLLLNVNDKCELLRAPIELEGVASPQDPLGREATHRRSGGYEGMSMNQAGTVLYPMLEKPTNEDEAAGRRRLRIHPFDVGTGNYTGDTFYYPLDEQASAIGDFSPVTDNLHLVVERDGGQGEAAKFKKIFLVDFSVRGEGRILIKRELVDLLKVADPHDLDRDGSTTFTFPFTTIEDVVVVDARTIAVANDNNYPFSAGRAAAPVIDNNEMILIRFEQRLSDMHVLP